MGHLMCVPLVTVLVTAPAAAATFPELDRPPGPTNPFGSLRYRTADAPGAEEPDRRSLSPAVRRTAHACRFPLRHQFHNGRSFYKGFTTIRILIKIAFSAEILIHPICNAFYVLPFVHCSLDRYSLHVSRP